MIRKATVEDADAVSALVKRAYAHWVPIVGGRPRPMDDDYRERLSALEGWVAARGDRVDGVIVLELEEDKLWVDNVAVDPAVAGTGIGRSLLDLGVRRARELGVGEIHLFTHELMADNRAIYERLGWVAYQPAAPLADFFVYYRKPVSA